MFTTQHYETVARIINCRYKIKWLDETYNTGYHEAIEDTVVELADYFAKDDTKFNKDMFLKNCGILEENNGKPTTQ